MLILNHKGQDKSPKERNMTTLTFDELKEIEALLNEQTTEWTPLKAKIETMEYEQLFDESVLSLIDEE